MLLALAEADAHFEKDDREQRRPSFPRIDGRPASAVERYLDSQATSKVRVLSFTQHAWCGVAMTCSDRQPGQGSCSLTYRHRPVKSSDPVVCQCCCSE